MSEGQKIALLVLVMSAGVGGMVLDHNLFGSFRMGSRTGTIGLIAICSAFLLGATLSALYPETIRPT
ncbi:hypothetical protein KX729_27770 [Rhizobium sp. XQZ8]|uniref:hypothetical protein n=1 Tax=Rhizobium populisoli TaxID=2859785 RepID=UPI001CA4BF3C|nr:hypothetical protein [Rhizobium populisoli]MBW6425233.1 hypothetical protein [Rhizobium populisoli]